MSYREAIRVFGTHCCKGNRKNPKMVQTEDDVFSIGCPQAISHLAQVEPTTGLGLTTGKPKARHPRIAGLR